ncbi:hypothetical protein C0995_006876 [Termitomyces sp. Mi166|nr:hypothetical protein C0995_006876 [Termitomyces sp. Mi166\
MTNPFWLVRVRMFTSRGDSPSAYRGLWDGLSTIVRTEGVLGLFRGTSLGLVGVSNGAIQFVVYEKMKKWGFDQKKRQYQKAGKEWNVDADKLDNAAAALFPTIPETIKRTWSQEGTRGFYRGLGTNLVRVLPGTCVTFVVYENLAWLLRSSAAKREQQRQANLE